MRNVKETVTIKNKNEHQTFFLSCILGAGLCAQKKLTRNSAMDKKINLQEKKTNSYVTKMYYDNTTY